MRRSLPALLAAGLITLPAVPAEANLLVNPGFEDSFNGWTTSGDTSRFVCATTVIGCAPDGGTFNAFVAAGFGGITSSSLSQAVDVVGPGTYAFGAYLSFDTDQIAGNFSQGQISLSVQGAGVSATLGADPNALAGDISIPGSGGFLFSEWMLFSGTLTYAGIGPASLLVNISAQSFDPDLRLLLGVDNVFIRAAAVPEPASLALLSAGLLGLGAAMRRRYANGSAA
ncbi:PEP-CTERM sorting domain-containing protein [Elioraea sp.]|uniref:PEP-CTERM sorting domain-containing protein n=1 Tax=Elioraea sp. TaxID=2185103 RepID=UPI003F70A22B